MKLIHCADIHLDSKLEANLDPDRARARRGELLLAFGALVGYAQKNAVRAIIVAGDLFDTDHVPHKSAEYVRGLIEQNPGIDFIYVRGNHDKSDFPARGEKAPDNLLMFPGGEWGYVDYGDCVVACCEPGETDSAYPQRLSLSPERVNIAVLHGQAASSRASLGESIGLLGFARQHIDYLALGHVHAYGGGALDARGQWRYSGCLEGRGFDECGQKGFVLLDVSDGRLSESFVPACTRELHVIEADITGLEKLLDIEGAVKRAAAGIPTGDMVQVNLTGKSSPTAQKDLIYLTQSLNVRFYFARVRDNSTLEINPEDFARDATLKGGFVRAVLSSDLDEDEKARVLRCGISAITGGEAEL